MSSAKSAGSAAQAREKLLALLDPLVTEAGFDLEDVTISAAGRRSLVRVVVDADGGVDLDAIALVSRVISDALDTADVAQTGVLAGSYVLEVSSPGVDRPLSEPRHWRRARGRLVAVSAGGQPLTGRVLDTSDTGVTLDVDGSTHALAWSDLGSGRVQVEFNRDAEGSHGS
ncbi:ribosome maturation factor RimP [uncultured Jatrophihabitans sp.]|uniref:ribosome maturation factor RimP n=1 Tax=uncultured Jatrophihabitans sp. TaxID=1610747 RepID=UPI0035CA0F9E